MKFFGRVEQRKKLHRILGKNQQMVSLIYGRRRVGKSELIKQVLRECFTEDDRYRNPAGGICRAELL